MNSEEAKQFSKSYRELKDDAYYEKDGKKITLKMLCPDPALRSEFMDGVMGFAQYHGEAMGHVEIKRAEEQKKQEQVAIARYPMQIKQDDRFGYRSEPESRLPIGVVITTRNYADYLRACLAGWNAQTLPPNSIIVIDDDSTDRPQDVVTEFPGVRYNRVNFHDANMARNRGMELISEPVIIFFDADNIPPKDYCALMADSMIDQRMAIAYPKIQYFGLENRPPWQNPSPCPYYLLEQSYVDTASAWRRCAVEQVGGWRPGVPLFQDWDLARRIVKAGWRITPSSAILQYRIHERQATFDKAKDFAYYPHLIQETADLTVFTPFAGRTQYLNRYFSFLAELDWPRDRLRLYFYDNSCNEDFGARLKNFLAEFKCAGTQYFVDRDPPKVTKVGYESHTVCNQIAQKMSGIFNHMRDTINTELVWIIEDDIIPPTNGARTLVSDLLPDVGMVSGFYRDRFHNRPLASHLVSVTPTQVEWQSRTNIKPNQEPPVIDVGLVGTGCLLVRLRTLKMLPFRYHPDGKALGADFLFSRDCHMEHRRVLLDTRVQCDHLSRR